MPGDLRAYLRFINIHGSFGITSWCLIITGVVGNDQDEWLPVCGNLCRDTLSLLKHTFFH